MFTNQKFGQILAIIVVLAALVYFFLASFFITPNHNKELIASVKDFLQNALIMILGFYYINKPKDIKP